MMNGDVAAGWIDITQEFKDDCYELEVGELLHDANFGLFEAMSAFEMMDPKMDSGIIGLPTSQPNKTVNKLKTVGFPNTELISIMDGTLCCVASWLEGGSMAQTIFANVHLRDPLMIEDRLLKSFSLGTLKLVAICKDVITSTCVYEEEHFQPSTHGFNLADSVSDQRVVGMLKESEDEVGKSLRSTKSKMHDDVALSPSEKESLAVQFYELDNILARIRIVKLLVTTILALKYSGAPATEEVVGKGLDKLRDTIQSVMDSTKDQPQINPLDLPMFDIGVTSRLLPPSFPRAVQLIPLANTLQMFLTICIHLNSVVHFPKRLGLVEAMDYVDSFSYELPSILVRSLLLYHYMPTGTGKVFNKHKLTDLVVDELRAFNSPPLFSPAYKSHIMSHGTIKLVLSPFLSSAAQVLDNLFAAKCNTRARQRERLAYLLEDLGQLQCEAERIDAVVDALIRDRGGGDKTHLSSAFGMWTLYLTTRTMIKYLTLGMELELYDIREYCYVFWYYSEVILLWNTSSLFRAERSLMEPSNLETKGACGKKKPKQKKPKSVVTIHQEELLMARCQQHISSGLYRLLLALKSADMLPTTGDYRYDNEQVRYTHRFAPFAAVNFPQMAQYQSYLEAVAMHEQMPPFNIIDVLRQSFKNFETARSILESDAVKMKRETSTLLNVAKNNMVVTRILADSLQKDIKRLVKFDFSFHNVFPMIKFVT